MDIDFKKLLKEAMVQAITNWIYANNTVLTEHIQKAEEDK